MRIFTVLLSFAIVALVFLVPETQARKPPNKKRPTVDMYEPLKGTSQILEEPVFARCEPELRTVRFKKLSHKDILIPAGIRLKRCGGCCQDDDLKSCQPTITKRHYYELTVRQWNSSAGNAVAANQMYLPPIRISQSLDEHLQCECQCVVKGVHCTASQVYDPKSCSCQCPDLYQRRQCENFNSPIFKWDENSCQCMQSF